ncbi:hypothetical protein KHQ89_00220 [Mycoplasmatota bacterium]|nr:hypothetical protein KHQ89_00220 [Mycoplasmatota bacterium]
MIGTKYEIFIALIITIIVESIVIKIFRKYGRKIVLLSVAMNTVTNLTMNLLLVLVFYNEYTKYLILFELLVILIEAVIYNLLIKDFNQSIKLSAACNVASFAAGRILYYTIRVIVVVLFLGISLFSANILSINDAATSTNIRIYALDENEIEGEYIIDFILYDYNYENTKLVGMVEMNYAQPIYNYYTIEVEELDDVIISVDIELRKDSYSFDYIFLENEKLYEEDLYSVTQDGTKLTVEILFENIEQEEDLYTLYDLRYMYVKKANGKSKNINIYQDDVLDLRGFCFFFGDLDDLETYQNEAYL